MAEEKMVLLCASCGWKRVCDSRFEGLVELKTDTLSSRKFRCLKCGRGVAPRKFPDPQAEVDRKTKDERLRAENDAFMSETAEFQRKFAEGMDGQ